MKRVLLIILCITSVSFVYTQSTNMGITKRFEGQGKIDKYQINLILDIITHPYYVDGDHVGEIQQLSGKYFYKKYEKDIFLSGTRKILFTQGESIISDSIKLFEFDENFNKVAVFTGVLNETSIEGNWVSIKNAKKISFYILFDQSKFTLLEVKTTKGKTILPIKSIGDYLNIYNQNEYNIKKVIEKNDKIYVLVSLAFTVCGALKTRGSGCGGHDVFLRLYEIDKNSIKYSEVKIFGYSIINFEESIDDKGFSVIIEKEENDKSIKKLFHVNFNEVDKGIKVSKL